MYALRMRVGQNNCCHYHLTPCQTPVSMTNRFNKTEMHNSRLRQVQEEVEPIPQRNNEQQQQDVNLLS